MRGEDGPAREGEWWEPDPFMDFSGSGLKFEDRLHCEAGDLVLLELSIPPAETLWRATARVVRVEPIEREGVEDADPATGDREPTHRVAIEFIDLPQEAAEALAAFTLKIQGALLAAE
jgi:hypothetical protein